MIQKRLGHVIRKMQIVILNCMKCICEWKTLNLLHALHAPSGGTARTAPQTLFPEPARDEPSVGPDARNIGDPLS